MSVYLKIRDRIVGACVCLFVIQFNASAQQDEAYQFAYHYAEKIKQRLLAKSHLLEDKRMVKVIRDTHFIIDHEIKLPSIAFAINDNQREIRVASEWITALSAYAEFIMPVSLDKSSENDIDMNLVPKKQNWQEFLVLTALSDVILHEYGHHVKDAFYGERPTPYQVHWAENTAEKWSMNMKFQLDIDDNELGKLLTLSSALMAVQTAQKKGVDYPPYATALLEQRFAEFCYRARHAFIDEACKRIMSQSLTAKIKRP